ncbi:MAG: peptidoglycan-associated lipoprotein Pal [Betaproteobacteria bacterium]|nr:peptidoglycan-associated lipoprotein Pal [Betaproteobacteria bacterium]
MNKLLVSVGMAMVLGACSSTQQPAQVADSKPAPVQQATAPTQPPTTAPTTTQQPTGVRVDPLKDRNSPLSNRVIYFDYDKDAVKPEFQALVQAHAKYLSENRTRKIRLEGHADERGSREYNMALGQRRSDAVRKAVSVLGVGNERVETVSFGEDKPKSNGHDEAAWAQNRRVEIVYDGE